MEDNVRQDLILLDDDLEIMVFPHKPTDPQWVTYEELDKLERTLSPKITRMIHTYNEMCSWTERMKLKMKLETGE
jgi:hypothetical protein